MTRHDVANLVIRIFALWLGVVGISTLASLPWLAWAPDVPARLFTTVVLILPFPAYAITPESVPPLASLVVGLTTLAGAVPQAVSLVVMLVVRGQGDASLMGPDVLPALDQRSTAAGTEVVARLVVGVVLIALSRRRGIWSTDAGDADVDAGDGRKSDAGDPR